MDKMRDEFVKWYNEASDSNGGVAYYVKLDGKYCFNDIQWLYDAWQASRAALVVELPGVESFGNLSYYAAPDMRAELDKAGIKYE